jgi:hypothetical protein
LKLCESQAVSNQIDEFITSLPLDSAEGCDDVESLLRSFSSDGLDVMLSVDANAGSGGYSEHIFKYAAQELLGIDLWTSPLQYKVCMNVQY